MAIVLLSPSMALLSAARAYGQFQAKPLWAVLEFEDQVQKGTPYGAFAANEFASDLGKAQPNLRPSEWFEVAPQETVARTQEALDIPSPVTGVNNMLRIGTEVRADTIISGTLVNYRVVSSNGAKHADVIMRVVIYDVKSGQPVNGSALQAASSDRVGDVKDETLIDDAISTAVDRAVRDILARSLPTGTVLNTTGDIAYVNQGSRSGFAGGQNLVIYRGRQQVGTGVVQDVDFDSAQIRVVRSTLGVQPGDQCRVIFTPPVISKNFGKGNEPIVVNKRGKSDNAGFVQLLLILGFFAFLLHGGGGESLLSGVTAQPGYWVGDTPDPTGQAGILVSYGTGGLLRGNQQRWEWEVYRNDLLTPIGSSDSSTSHYVDFTAAHNWSYHDPSGLKTSGQVCNTAAPAQTAVTGTAGPTFGTPYAYDVRLIYTLLRQDLQPNPTSGNADDTCYFVTTKATSVGSATVLDRPALISPDIDATVTGATTFSFTSVVGSQFPIKVDYIIELSTSPDFAAGTTYAATNSALALTTGVSGTLAIGQIDLNKSLTADSVRGVPSYILNASSFYWRIGARNHADKPGPVADASGQRYMWSESRKMIRPVTPPNP